MLSPEGGTVTDSETTSADSDATQTPVEAPPIRTRRSPLRAAAAGLGRHRKIARGLGVLVVAAIIGAAYVVGAPPTSAIEPPIAAAATAGPADLFGAAGVVTGTDQTKSLSGSTDSSNGAVAVPNTIPVPADQTGKSSSGQSAVVAAADANQIIKTGSMTLEVADVGKAMSDSQKAISGLGGTVDSSNQFGTGTDAAATITFKVPAAQWDAAVAALRGIGNKVLSLQSGTTDVTSQVIDLGARIDNLQKTEAALQAIMAKATAVSDVLAVETQLSSVEGQIEELQAEQKNLKNQAAMSTLTVSFQLPAATVTTQATQDWTLSKQVDEAGAALVRIGQGLATMVVWLFIVVVPIAVAALLLLAIFWIVRRIARRGRRGNAVAGA
jgi:hypothetical protein